MPKFRLVLVLLCLGILGALPFVISQPKPDAAKPAVQRETAVQRQMAAQQQAAVQASAPVRAEIGAPLERARNLAAAGEYGKALAIVAGLEAVPNKTAHELSMISQMHVFLTVKANNL